MTDGPDVATRARELATWQCEPEEIAAVIGEETGWDEERVKSWMVRFAGVITHARLTARAELRGLVWRNATNKQRKKKNAKGEDVLDLFDCIGKEQWAIVSELMRQHAGWARNAPMDELMRAFIAAQKAQDKKGPKTVPTLVGAA
jgi:hypothetical protein